MPEVPQNMQDDLQRMELEARSVGQVQGQGHHSPQPPVETAPGAQDPTQHYRGDEFTDWKHQKYAESAAAGQRAADDVPVSSDFRPFRSADTDSTAMEAPSFSPFPTVKGENIPPTDSEQEEILWQARSMVLHSNNVPMQIAWARDALMWVEVAANAAARDWKRDGKGRERPATPKVEHELRMDAVNILEFLASQEHPQATFMKGKWQEQGKFGYRENKKEAYISYKMAADNGFGRAEYRMGMLYENSNDIEKAIKHYTIGSEQLNDSASHYRLGMMYLMGQHNLPKNYQKGLELINMSADNADEDAPQGAYVFGMLVARELPDIPIPEGVLPFEPSVARQYVEKAAFLGFSKAQLKMGQAYELSQLGCDFNPALSLHYYGLAARQNQPEAALGVSRWFLFGSQNGEFPKNEGLAFRYAQDAAESGLHTGEFAMGYYHEVGIHVPIDLREARRWYEMAAEHGNKDAIDRIEGLKQSKSLTKQDHETTTLTRIKSQHGSQRGGRPERFSRANDVMATVKEDNMPPSVPSKAGYPHHDTVDFPDPSKRNTFDNRPPAFTVNLDQTLAIRPKSAAPYPQDDRPAPLNLRPQSVAPYPEDDFPGGGGGRRPPLSPHYNPGIRPSAGPHADRPLSAFGVRPSSPGGQQNLQPNDMRTGRLPQQGPPPPSNAGGWEPQVPQGYRHQSPGNGAGYGRRQSPGPAVGYRPASPGSAPGYRRPSPTQQQQQGPPYDTGPGPSRLGPANGGGGQPVGDPTRNRLQKPNPNTVNPNVQPPYPQQNGPPSLNAQPGRDYGPRTSSRPASDNYGGYPPHNGGGHGRFPSSGSDPNMGMHRPDRVDSLPPGRVPGGGGGGLPPKPRPGHLQDPMAGGGRTSSAPPAAMQAQYGRPGSARPQGGAAPSNMSAASLPLPPKVATDHPDGKTMGQGPATFEEMGIPQGKNEGDCVSSLFSLDLFPLSSSCCTCLGCQLTISQVVM
jgi:TPR repeat protein